VGDGGRSAVTVQQCFKENVPAQGRASTHSMPCTCHTPALRHKMLGMHMRSCRRTVQVDGELRGSELSNSRSDSPEGMWPGTLARTSMKSAPSSMACVQSSRVSSGSSPVHAGQRVGLTLISGC